MGYEQNQKSFAYDKSSDEECLIIKKSKKYQNIFLDISSPEKSPQHNKNVESLQTVISKNIDTSILKQEIGEDLEVILILNWIQILI